MEPMTLGTPSNSGPSSPSTPTGSPYLPSFLLGEPSTPVQNGGSPVSKRGNMNESQSTYMSPHSFPNKYLSQNHSSRIEHPGESEKISGPPIQGLFDTVTSPVPSRTPRSAGSDIDAYVATVSRQFNEGRTPSASNETIDPTWVTVFGYPPAAASFILSQLAACGQIVSHKVPASSNWMHVQFSSKLEARRALAYNGKVFAGTVMVGVLPCRDHTILQEKTNDSSSVLSPSFTSPTRLYQATNQSSFRSPVDPSFYESPYTSPRISQARPLISRQDTEVYRSGSTPQKSTGIVSKAMELFGW